MENSGEQRETLVRLRLHGLCAHESQIFTLTRSLWLCYLSSFLLMNAIWACVSVRVGNALINRQNIWGDCRIQTGGTVLLLNAWLLTKTSFVDKENNKCLKKKLLEKREIAKSPFSSLHHKRFKKPVLFQHLLIIIGRVSFSAFLKCIFSFSSSLTNFSCFQGFTYRDPRDCFTPILTRTPKR